jgi:hypothetical protein
MVANFQGKTMRKFLVILGLAAATVLSGCGYNDFQTKDEAVKKAWAEVLNQYQRRADLIPNLVATVQGYATQEKDVLLGVTEARSKVGSMTLTANCNRSWKVPRTVSPSHASVLPMRSRPTTCWRDSFLPT